MLRCATNNNVSPIFPRLQLLHAAGVLARLLGEIHLEALQRRRPQLLQAVEECNGETALDWASYKTAEPRRTEFLAVLRELGGKTSWEMDSDYEEEEEYPLG